ncbi:MAG: type II toxin-antitoxin system VapC family toxin [Dehalococcoidia bacterium]
MIDERNGERKMTTPGRECVVDASTVLAAIKREPGYQRAIAAIQTAIISSVNFAEVASHLAKSGVSLDEIKSVLSSFALPTIDFNMEQALEAARLHPLTVRQGLSLGDRACLALAVLRGLPVMTADRKWASVDIGIEIVLVR